MDGIDSTEIRINSLKIRRHDMQDEYPGILFVSLCCDNNNKVTLRNLTKIIHSKTVRTSSVRVNRRVMNYMLANTGHTQKNGAVSKVNIF
jgi:hypothetical protein